MESNVVRGHETSVPGNAFEALVGALFALLFQPDAVARLAADRARAAPVPPARQTPL